MFYDPDGNGISLPAWVSGELADNELPLEDPLPSAPLRRVLRTPEASPGLGVRPHGSDTRRAPAPTSHARESLRPERPYRPGIAKPKYPAGGDIGGRQKKHYCAWHRTLLRWEANTVVSEAKHSSVRTGNTIVLLFHAIQPTLAGWRVQPNNQAYGNEG